MDAQPVTSPVQGSDSPPLLPKLRGCSSPNASVMMLKGSCKALTEAVKWTCQISVICFPFAWENCLTKNWERKSD